MKKHHPNSTTKSLLRSFARVGVAIIAICAIVAICYLYGRFVEAKWIKVKTVSLSDSPSITLIHISDTHYKGDKKYLSKVVKIINRTPADFVCFTGDLIEEKKYLPDCLEILSAINKPLYGISGNHDEWALVRSQDLSAQFAITDGRWLKSGDEAIYSNRVIIVGVSSSSPANFPSETNPAMKRILLNHYPSTVHNLPENSYDLILAGHTHGGQVCLPFVGNPVLRDIDTAYLKGIFHTKAGTLYVNPGIGTYLWPIRFRCRPEITIIKM